MLNLKPPGVESSIIVFLQNKAFWGKGVQNKLTSKSNVQSSTTTHQSSISLVVKSIVCFQILTPGVFSK